MRDNQKVTKYFTKLLIERLKPDTISSKTKWDIKLNLVLDDDKWVKINNQTFQLSDDTLLRTFQYKINNRILYTNDKLYIFKLTDTELCSFCTETKETLLYHLWECHFVKTLWIRLKETLNNALKTNILLQPEVFIFNIYEGEYSGVVNTCFLLIKKKYIYNCKCNDKSPSFEQAKKQQKKPKKKQIQLVAQGPCTGHRSIIAILYCLSFKYMKREKGRDLTQYTNLCGLNTLPH